MEKRIFRSMSLLMLLTMLFFALLWGFSSFGRMEQESRERIRELRVTVLNQAGDVLFDSERDPQGLENHLQRAEVQQALRTGWGEGERYSDTMGRPSYYYAEVMQDGHVLRLAYTMDSLSSWVSKPLTSLLASIGAAILFASLLAKRLTRSVVAPINRLDLSGPLPKGYEELMPLYRRIEGQRKELAEQEIEVEERRAIITAISENMREGFLLLDRDGRILLANDSVLRMFDQKEAAGKSAQSLCREPDFTQEVRRCLSGQKGECTLNIKGRLYQVLLNPIYQDAVNGAVVLFIDVTQRRNAEQQRKEFSANVSHELKTPLTTISVLSELMADGKVSQEEMLPFAKRVKQQSDRLVNIVNDIIKLSSFDEGKASGEFGPVDIRELCLNVAEILRDKAAHRQVSLSLEGEGELEVWGDRGMLDEMLFNLVDNAIKYNVEGGSVVLSYERTAKECLIRVRDTGIGIAQAHLGHVFERFYRADKSRSKKTGGTGLGLSIVKHVAEYHAGRVEVQSVEGEGSVFICHLPLRS